jgi:hypothetical protein
MLRSFAKPPNRLCIVLGRALTAFIPPPEVVLGISISVSAASR